MADTNEVMAQLRNFNSMLLRVTALEVQAEMKRMTPVDTGALRAAVQIDLDNVPTSATVFNNLPYAKRVYLEGHSRQLPQGEFQAFVARIPARMEQIARGLRR